MAILEFRQSLRTERSLSKGKKGKKGSGKENERGVLRSLTNQTLKVSTRRLKGKQQIPTKIIPETFTIQKIAIPRSCISVVGVLKEQERTVAEEIKVPKFEKISCTYEEFPVVECHKGGKKRRTEEDISDEAMKLRHHKHEVYEKKVKKWDYQWRLNHLEDEPPVEKETNSCSVYAGNLVIALELSTDLTVQVNEKDRREAALKLSKSPKRMSSNCTKL